MEWIKDRWNDLTGLGSGGWLAIAAWVAIVFAVITLIVVVRQLQKNRQAKADEIRPNVVMFMEPNAADWHVIELVVRNFGQGSAHDITFQFANPPTVAQYEDHEGDGLPEVAELALPSELPVLAPGQEWRTVWDSAISRDQLGGQIRSRFDGVITYFDSPRPDAQRSSTKSWRKRREFQNTVTLDWATLQPVQRLELLTTHDLAKREKQKLELLRSLLTYFHYATKETRPDVFRAEIDRINQAVRETQDRWRTRQFDDTTEIESPWQQNQPLAPRRTPERPQLREPEPALREPPSPEVTSPEAPPHELRSPEPASPEPEPTTQEFPQAQPQRPAWQQPVPLEEQPWGQPWDTDPSDNPDAGRHRNGD
jgi:hypothetical protein